jgi:hypothetical protein
MLPQDIDQFTATLMIVALLGRKKITDLDDLDVV